MTVAVVAMMDLLQFCREDFLIHAIACCIAPYSNTVRSEDESMAKNCVNSIEFTGMKAISLSCVIFSFFALNQVVGETFQHC